MKQPYMIYISSNNGRHPVTKTFTAFHYTCQHFTFVLKLHPTTLHFFPFKLHPTTVHYPLIVQCASIAFYLLYVWL